MCSFQSTRPQGARQVRCIRLWRRICFNPRARRGRDFLLSSSISKFICFNPRARRGRDPVSMLHHSTPWWCFNPRARRGRDLACPRRRGGFHEFQSTRPQGARHVRRRCWLTTQCFNPRARRGRDKINIPAMLVWVVSIHAPAGGATVCGFKGKLISPVSIHAPAGGATNPRVYNVKKVKFQSTRPQGARPV